MSNAIEKIRVAESDVLRARRNLLTDVFKNHFTVDNTEDTVVHGNDGAMTAKVFASSAGFRVARYAVFAGREDDLGVFRRQWKPVSVGRMKLLTRQRNQRLRL